MTKFEWDANKAASNVRKHAVSFDEPPVRFFSISLRSLALILTIPPENPATSRLECQALGVY